VTISWVPVTINGNKEWSVVDGLAIDDYAQKMLDITGEVCKYFYNLSLVDLQGHGHFLNLDMPRYVCTAGLKNKILNIFSSFPY
jgi:hypothetical protein